eukprot:c11536_g1_i1.p1 GENE.c11536_g1_i1~~c11536_g1_i1.p1  ORF type:complete len:350 (-),score=73.53 c11536_g1_i1:506-1522(-)
MWSCSQSFAALRIILRSLISIFDVFSDIVVVGIWLRNGDIAWASFSIVFISLNTFVQVRFVVIRLQKITGLGGVLIGLFQLTHAVEGWRTLQKVKRGQEVTSEDTPARDTEILLEAAPQSFLQFYVIVHQGLAHTHSFNLFSACMSFISLSLGLAAKLRADTAWKQKPQHSSLEEASVAVYVASDMVVRVLCLCVFANAFRFLALPFLLLVILGASTIYWITTTKHSAIESLIALFGAGPMLTFTPYAGKDNPHAEKYATVWTTLCCLVFAASAVFIPNGWRDRESDDVKQAFAVSVVVCVVVKILFVVVYRRVKYGGCGAGCLNGTPQVQPERLNEL